MNNRLTLSCVRPLFIKAKLFVYLIFYFWFFLFGGRKKLAWKAYTVECGEIKDNSEEEKYMVSMALKHSLENFALDFSEGIDAFIKSLE